MRGADRRPYETRRQVRVELTARSPNGSDVFTADEMFGGLLALLVQVITEEAAAPFAIISGRETQSSDYEGISMELMEVRTTNDPVNRTVAVGCATLYPLSIWLVFSCHVAALRQLLLDVEMHHATKHIGSRGQLNPIYLQTGRHAM